MKSVGVSENSQFEEAVPSSAAKSLILDLKARQQELDRAHEAVPTRFKKPSEVGSS